MTFKMSDTDRLNLQKMINANDAEDTTGLIQEVKHSKDIRNEVQQLLNIKKQYSRLAKVILPSSTLCVLVVVTFSLHATRTYLIR